MKRIICVILTAVISLGLFVNIGTAGAYADTDDTMAYPEAPLLLETVDKNYYDFKLVAQTEKIAMYLMEANVSLAILNKESGTIWASTVGDDVLDKDGYLESTGSTGSHINVETGEKYDNRLDKFRSLFVFYTNDKKSESMITKSWYSAEDFTLLRETAGGGSIINEDAYHRIDYTALKNGVRIQVNKSRVGYKLTADFELDTEDNTLIVSCESKGAGDEYNNDSNGLAGGGGSIQYERTIEFAIMPYFGAATDRDSGYVFLPDGSGSIAEFTATHSSSESSTAMMIFAPATKGASGLSQLKEAEEEGIMPVLYPVFGMKKNHDAFFAIITDGEERALINYSPSGNITNYNLVYASFMTKPIGMSRSDPSTESWSWYTDGTHQYEGMYSVKYYFFSDEDANYSKFAETYRNYLLDNEMLNDAISDDDEMPLALDIFMNTYTESAFGSSSVVMTDFDEAYDMIEKLYESGVSDMLINISSWQKNGISYEKVTPVYSKLGGASGLKKLTELTNKLGFDIFMQVNMVKASSNTTGFKASRNAARDIEDLIVEMKWGDGSYLISPVVMLDRYNDIYLEYFEDMGISGFNYEMLGYFLYNFSFSQEHYYKEDTKDYFTKILSESKNDFGKNAVWYGNSYSLAYADWIYDLPSTDTGYPSTTRSVPFAQMVLHGYIPYTSIAGNTFYDETLQTLKWIEYGYIPYYKLAAEDTSNLLDTEMSNMFSAKFEDWSDRVVDKYNLFKEEFGSLYTLTMVRHDEVMENVYVTEYSDGTKIYVNYSEFRVKIGNDQIVESMDYLVVKG